MAQGLIVGARLWKSFFDEKKVRDPAERAALKVLARFGAYVRTDARQSIRRAAKPSPPGRPPRSVTGRLKQHIYFVVERAKRNVVIGPTLFAKSARDLPAAAALEYGGPSWTTRRMKRRTEAGTKPIVERRKVKVKIRAHPFMRPAFQKVQQKLPELWREVLAKTT
jgi:hypothetical protein